MAQKTYAVTGVASGIGAELARILRQRGHRVVGFDIRDVTENVDRFHKFDLNDPDAIDAATRAVDDELDGLCNNAGLPPRPRLEETLLRVNFLGTRAFTAGLVDKVKPEGAILNVASRAGHGWRDNVDQIKRLAALTSRSKLDDFVASEGIDATRCYNLSKEAVILWTMAETEAMVQRGIRINSLSPGGVATGILDDFAAAFGEKMARNVERAGRPGKPEEVAEIAAFALSPEAGWLKGEDISIDGGMGAFGLTDALDLSGLRAGSAT